MRDAEHDTQSWPVGPAPSGVTYQATATGAVVAGGARISDESGWIEVALPPDAVARGLPAAIATRIRIDTTGEAPRIHVEDVRAGARQYGGLHRFAEAGGLSWIAHLIDAVCEEVHRRVTGALALPSPRVAVS